MSKKIFTYIKENQTRKVYKLLRDGQDPNVASKGESAITNAAKWGRFGIVELLIKYNARISIETLEAAIERGRKEIVKLLLQSGASANVDSAILEKAQPDIAQMVFDAQQKQAQSSPINHIDVHNLELVENQPTLSNEQSGP
jgi:ankyrin repeat protein